jgi:hypothetical protein
MAQTFDREIRAAARETGIPEDLIRSVIKVESNFNPRAVGAQGEQGLMQLGPDLARSLPDPFEPRANIRRGAQFLKELLDRFGDQELALAAYNAGPTRVSRLGRRIFSEIPSVRRYVDRVLGRMTAIAESPEPRLAPPTPGRPSERPTRPTLSREPIVDRPLISAGEAPRPSRPPLPEPPRVSVRPPLEETASQLVPRPIPPRVHREGPPRAGPPPPARIPVASVLAHLRPREAQAEIRRPVPGHTESFPVPIPPTFEPLEPVEMPAGPFRPRADVPEGPPPGVPQPADLERLGLRLSPLATISDRPAPIAVVIPVPSPPPPTPPPLADLTEAGREWHRLYAMMHRQMVDQAFARLREREAESLIQAP